MISAQSCFSGASWPKLIGYGKADTSVIAIDRRTAPSPALFLAMVSDEADFVFNAGTSATTIGYLALDETTETYMWFKVMADGRYNTGDPNYAFVHVSPDGSKVLATFFVPGGALVVQNFVYLDANTGAVLASAHLPDCCKRFYGRDAIVVGNTSIFTLGNLANDQSALVGFTYDGAASLNEIGWLRWELDDDTGL